MNMRHNLWHPLQGKGSEVLRLSFVRTFLVHQKIMVNLTSHDGNKWLVAFFPANLPCLQQMARFWFFLIFRYLPITGIPNFFPEIPALLLRLLEAESPKMISIRNRWKKSSKKIPTQLWWTLSTFHPVANPLKGKLHNFQEIQQGLKTKKHLEVLKNSSKSEENTSLHG